MRRSAERRLSMETVSPNEVLRFFSAHPPLTPGGHAQHAFALQALGRRDEARAAARRAWAAGVLPQTDEQRLVADFRGGFVRQDHEQRIEVLLGNGDWQSATRSPQLGAGREAGLVGGADRAAEPRRRRGEPARPARFRRAARSRAAARPGDLAAGRPAKARRRGNCSPAARSSGRRPAPRAGWRPLWCWRAAPPMTASGRPPTASRRGCAGLYPAGTDVSDRPYGERDDYTSLAWLGGTAALHRLGRPADAARMFELYARAARSPQTRAKGFYWAARAATAAIGPGQANGSSSPPPARTSFTASSRSSGSAAPRTRRPPRPRSAPAERAEFARRDLAEAIRYLGLTGQRSDQTAFVRALAEQLRDDRERALAGDFGRQVGRLDLGVWAAREARSTGDDLLRRRRLPDRLDAAGLCPPLGVRARHHPPGKLVRAHRGQPCRRARADAADAGHRPPGGEPGRRILRPRPAHRRPAIQYPARQPASRSS